MEYSKKVFFSRGQVQIEYWNNYPEYRQWTLMSIDTHVDTRSYKLQNFMIVYATKHFVHNEVCLPHFITL